jgi:hypothetical protein
MPPIEPVSLELSGVEVWLRCDVLLRLARLVPFDADERFERFVPDVLRELAFDPLFAREVLRDELFDPARDFDREAVLLRDELVFERLPARPDFFAPPLRAAAAFTLPRLPRDFVLRLLLPLRDALLLRERRPELRPVPASPIIPPPAVVSSSILSIIPDSFRAMAPVS